MKNWAIHYKNKFPGALVQQNEQSFDVFRGEDHLISLVKNGANQWVDQSEAMGLPERHDLAPIPKDARVYKEVAGKIALAEEAAERRELRKKYMGEGDKVLSIDELKVKGLEFDEKGREIKK